MLGSLHGTVLATLPDGRSLIEVNGVGYWVQTGAWRPGGEVRAYLYHHVREEASDLYGFPTLEALGLFEKLISVSGIGPKAGLSLLSLGDAAQLAQAIDRQDTAYLGSAPGVGTKAAQKIVLELAGKLGLIAGSGQLPISQYQELRLALEGLGYKPAEITPIIQEVPGDLPTLDEQLRWSLRRIGK